MHQWGDIDYGGILIFEHLKRTYFPTIRPLLMDESTFLNYSQYGMAFSNDYAIKLERLLFDDSYLEWHGLIQRMLEKNRRVEQESLVMEVEVE
ncbi:Wadjet anti-phage system protein JetD domain-containing protein [Chryseomicrobium sp. FSL W7-1435]|uniref:Wadjet anti-phage system protein JetD domain-containing protein n=1 Tax=Chryseomicrobium sp. FSL W7-1435 TaxID=2921704 RepID=UPI00315A7756